MAGKQWPIERHPHLKANEFFRQFWKRLNVDLARVGAGASQAAYVFKQAGWDFEDMTSVLQLWLTELLAPAPALPAASSSRSVQRRREN